MGAPTTLPVSELSGGNWVGCYRQRSDTKLSAFRIWNGKELSTTGVLDCDAVLRLRPPEDPSCPSTGSRPAESGGARACSAGGRGGRSTPDEVARLPHDHVPDSSRKTVFVKPGTCPANSSLKAFMERKRSYSRAVYEQFDLGDPEKDIIPPAGVNTTAARWRDAEACSSRATRVVLEDEDDAEHEHQVALALKEQKGYAVRVTPPSTAPGSSSSATNRRSSAQAKESQGGACRHHGPGQQLQRAQNVCVSFFREEFHRGQSKWAGDGLATDPTKSNVGPALSRYAEERSHPSDGYVLPRTSRAPASASSSRRPARHTSGCSSRRVIVQDEGAVEKTTATCELVYEARLANGGYVCAKKWRPTAEEAAIMNAGRRERTFTRSTLRK